MRLSRLSDRQLRRLIRNADVRFEIETPEQWDNYHLAEIGRSFKAWLDKSWPLKSELRRKIRSELDKIENNDKRAAGARLYRECLEIESGALTKTNKLIETELRRIMNTKFKS